MQTSKDPAVFRYFAMGTLVLILVFTLASVATAREGGDGQQRPDGPPSVEQIFERMQQNLSLTNAQSSQIKQILEQEHSKHEAAHKDAMQAMSKVLTSEQMQKMQNHQSHGPQGNHNQGNGSGESNNGNNHSRGAYGDQPPMN